MNYIQDSKFEDVSATVVNSHDKKISNADNVLGTWRIKNSIGNVYTTAAPTSQGLHLVSMYGSDVGYVYLRQIVPNIKRLSGKKMTLQIEMSVEEMHKYDIYVSARYSSDDKNRVTVVDTDTRMLLRGSSVVELTFTVPKYKGQDIDRLNGLSVALRLIGTKESTIATIRSIKLFGDTCTWFPEYLFGVYIGGCCFIHDNDCNTSDFYDCLQEKMKEANSELKRQLGSWLVAAGGTLGCIAKYPKKLWLRLIRGKRV